MLVEKEVVNITFLENCLIIFTNNNYTLLNDTYMRKRCNKETLFVFSPEPYR